MNKEYSVSTDNKILVSTDEGMVVRENKDNIDKILVKENLLEEIMNKITEYTLKRDTLEKDIKESIFTAIICPIVAMSMVTAMNGLWAMINSPIIINYIYYLFGIALSILAISVNGKRARKKSKEKQGVINEINYLIKIYEIEKSKLNELENKKTNNTNIEEINKVKSVDDKEVLEQLKRELILYYNCGYEQKKYNNWYEKGNLKQKLESKKIYDEEEINKIEEILNEIKEQSYVKTIGQKRK